MNSTLQNGFKLIELLAAHGQEVSLTSLAVLAALPPSHVCRLLKTLVLLGYVEQNRQTRHYRISLKVLHLANKRLGNLDVRRCAHPFILKLAASVGGYTFISLPMRGRSIIVDVAYPPHVVADATIVIGQMHPVWHSACGKLCAAFAEPEEQEYLCVEPAEEISPEVRGARLAELAQIRQEHWAVRSEVGVLAVAAPLFRSDNIFCGALGVFLPEDTILSTSVEQEVKRTAGAISFALGYPFSQ